MVDPLFTDVLAKVHLPAAAAFPDGETQDVMINHATFDAFLRHYSDFLWLFERLHTEKAGAIIPQFPSKPKGEVMLADSSFEVLAS